jgi:SpoVK/Ycf46/Vps4 family AAA+-type ATPase
MDEIDSIGSTRMESGSGNGDSEVQRTMLELLNQLDGFEASNKIKVWFSTFLFSPGNFEFTPSEPQISPIRPISAVHMLCN